MAKPGLLVYLPPLKVYLSIVNLYVAAVAIGLGTLHLHSRWSEWKPAVLRNMKIVYALVGFYVLFNLFIIVMIWYPPDHQGAVNSYVTPGVSTGIIGFGLFYWLIFAKASPALGYQIEDEEEGKLWAWEIYSTPSQGKFFSMLIYDFAVELADGTRWVTYKVCLA